jgi:hypothetical protein
MNEQQIREDERKKIVKWLNGLESRLADLIDQDKFSLHNQGKNEFLAARRGVYSGIASDIKNGAHNRGK